MFMHNSLISLALTILMLPSFLSDNDLKQNESSKVALLQRSVSLFDLKEGRNSDLKEKDKEVKR